MIKIACATNDGKNFIKEHFGRAEKYLIFEINENDFLNKKSEKKIIDLNNFDKFFKLIDEVRNIPFEEKMDGDPEKAKTISQLLKPLGVSVLVNKAMGPNIVRMRKQFVCVITNINDIKETLIKIDLEQLINELKKPEGTDKKVVYVKNEK